MKKLKEYFSQINLKKVTRNGLKWFFGILVSFIIAILFLEPLRSAVWGPDNFEVMIVGNFTDSTAIKIKQGFKETFNHQIVLGGTPVKVNTIEWSDNGDPETAARIASDLVKKNNVLFVVGHFFSSTTKSALPKYMETKHPIPVILTTETNPFLIPSSEYSLTKYDDHFDVYQPIYSLSPDDYNQSETAAAFAVKKADRFWIIQDVDNNVYSSFLAKNFKNEILKYRNKKVLLQTNNTFVPSLNQMQQLDINGIFFAGDWKNALVMIQQLKSIYKEKKIPLILLSDGCANQGLLRQLQKDVEDIYLLHAQRASVFCNENYNIYGKNAAKEINEIIETAGSLMKVHFIRKWLKINNVILARKAVREAMMIKYRCQHRIEESFHVWEIIWDSTAEKCVFQDVGPTN